MHANLTHTRFTEILPHFGKKVSFGLLGFSPSFGKDSDNEVATKQLTAVVDFTFLPHDNPEIS